MSDAIRLRGMRFHVLVGILEHEKQYPQPLEVDLTAWLAADMLLTRAVDEQSVDYRELYYLVEDEVNREPVGFIEELAVAIAERALRDRRIARVEVVVRKPHVTLPGPLAAAEVCVERRARE